MTCIHNFIEFWKEVISLKPNEDETLFFRGHTKCTYDCCPTVLRNNAPDIEQKIYRDMQCEYPEKFRRAAHLSNLVMMQHYGAQTRLLDLSRNPLISLYFACEANPKEDGEVCCFKVNKKKILPHNSDKALMLSCLPHFSDVEKKEIEAFCRRNPRRIDDIDIQNNKTMRRFLHEIRGEYPSFASEIIGGDLLKYYFIAVNKDNDRIKIQDGAFVIFGLGDNLVEELEQEKISIIINSSSKRNILEELKLMKIDTSTVYPDFERRAMLINNKRVNWINIGE